ncbi:MAG: hypothetical protein AAGA58_05810 [Verrucomicrobiota bacterium]
MTETPPGPIFIQNVPAIEAGARRISVIECRQRPQNYERLARQLRFERASFSILSKRRVQLNTHPLLANFKNWPITCSYRGDWRIESQDYLLENGARRFGKFAGSTEGGSLSARGKISLICFMERK